MSTTVSTLLQALDLSRRLTCGYPGFIVSSSHLASEYLQMGKATRAGVVFAQAAGRLTLSSSTSGVPLVSDSAKVMYLSRYAEYLAVIGHHDKRSVHLPLPIAVLDTDSPRLF